MLSALLFVLNFSALCSTVLCYVFLQAKLLKDACSHKATSVVKFLASTVDKHMLNHQGYYSLPLSTVSTVSVLSV